MGCNKGEIELGFLNMSQVSSPSIIYYAFFAKLWSGALFESVQSKLSQSLQMTKNIYQC